jgi:phosphatidylinositol 3-kinase
VLLTPKGNLFHIDFGYLLGRDPKPLPPPFKLVKEMVEAMVHATPLEPASSAHVH